LIHNKKQVFIAFQLEKKQMYFAAIIQKFKGHFKIEWVFVKDVK